MRILFINSVYNYGSTGHIIADLKSELKNKGNEVKVAFGRHIERADQDSIIIGNRFDILFSGIGSRLFDNHGLMNKRATRKFIKEIDKQDFDIIHLHNLHGYYINYPILFKYLANKNIPVVWTLHDGWSMTGHAAYGGTFFSNGLNERKKNIKNKYPISFFASRNKRNIKIKKKYMGMLADCTIVTPSRWLMGKVDGSYLGKYNKQVIPNGIDLSIFRVKDKINIKKDGKKIILGVSNGWSKYKGFDDFIKLRSVLKNNFDIVLIGLDKNQISKLPKGIIGIERTDSLEQLVDWYNRADVFLNLTYEDNYPTTNLEALACGTKVITYDTGGSPEPISNRNGLVVNVGNIKALIDAIYSINGRVSKVDRSLNKYDMIKDYELLFKRILKT